MGNIDGVDFALENVSVYDLKLGMEMNVGGYAAMCSQLDNKITQYILDVAHQLGYYISELVKEAPRTARKYANCVKQWQTLRCNVKQMVQAVERCAMEAQKEAGFVDFETVFVK